MGQDASAPSAMTSPTTSRSKASGIVVVGNFLDELKLGDFDKKANGSDDVYVLALDLAGAPQWLWTAGGIDSDGANAVAATPDGGWVIGGSFSDTITIGTQSFKSQGRTDAFLLKLDAGGDLAWVKQYGGRYNDSIRHVAVDANGNIYVQGEFADHPRVGAGLRVTATGGAAFPISCSLASTIPTGITRGRNTSATGSRPPDAGGLAVDPAGHVTIVGSFDKTISFGKGDQHTSLGESDIFVARLTTDGKLEWARTYGGERVDAANGVAGDSAVGNSVVSGWFQNSVDFGKGTVTSKGNKDVFALKLDPQGGTVWVQAWGDHDHDQGRAVAIDDKNQPVIAGPLPVLYRWFDLKSTRIRALPTAIVSRSPTCLVGRAVTLMFAVDRHLGPVFRQRDLCNAPLGCKGSPRTQEKNMARQEGARPPRAVARRRRCCSWHRRFDRCSRTPAAAAGDALDGLNGYVGWLVFQAAKRATENSRKTVRAHDFMIVNASADNRIEGATAPSCVSVNAFFAYTQ